MSPGPENSPRLHETFQLVAAAQGGDRQAMEDLFARYLPRVRRIVSLRMGYKLASFIELDDVTQEALLQVFHGLDRFEKRTEGSFRNWVAHCVESAIKDSARRLSAKKRGAGEVVRFRELENDVPLSTLFAGSGPTPSKVAADREVEERIEEALLELPPHHREIINLRYFCGMSFAEISETLEIGSAATARKALHRAVEKLKNKAALELP